MFCFRQRIASAYMYTLTQLVNILTNTLGKAREREGEGERERERERDNIKFNINFETSC